MANKLYRPGGPKSGEQVTVIVTPSGIEASTGDETVLLPFVEMTGKPVGFEDAYIALAHPSPEGMVELWVPKEFMGELRAHEGAFDPAFRERFLALRTTQRKRGARRMGFRVAGLAVVACILWFIVGGGLATTVVKGIPIELEEAIGDSAVSDLSADYSSCENEEVVAAVQQVLDALVVEAGDTGYTFTLHVLTSEDVNAFALPGGHVFVLSGLLEMTEDPSELAAVMGHEMQHVLGRHGLRSIVQRAGVGVVMAMVLGDVSETVAVVAGLAGELGVLRFGREQESEADEVGLRLIGGAGFDPQGASRFFSKLSAEAGETGTSLDSAIALLSTHPASSDRMKRLDELSATYETPAKPLLHELDWATLRKGCGTAPQ